MLQKSAVSSSQTIIFVPSYFDFVRLKRYMKKLDDFSFTSISESVLLSPSLLSLTPNAGTPRLPTSRALAEPSSAARSRSSSSPSASTSSAGPSFSLLLLASPTPARRYRIRGAKTFVFYAPPDHASYYPEVLSFPFAKDTQEPEVDESELSCQVVFSKFDLLRLERICGGEDARKMMAGGQEATRFTFI